MSADDASPQPGDYGQPISPERQAELQAILDDWNAPGADHGDRRGPFDTRGMIGEFPMRLGLSGADAGWLADKSGRSEFGDVPDLHLEGAHLGAAHLEGAHLGAAHLERVVLHYAYLTGAFLRHAYLEGASLTGAYLELAWLDFARLSRADLREAHLEGATLGFANLEDAYLTAAHLEGAGLPEAHLERAHLDDAHLEGADLSGAHLEDADLRVAHLERVVLRGAHLEGADLSGAHLEGADLSGAHLEGADLGYAHLDGKTYQVDDPDFQRIRRIVADFPVSLPPADLRSAVLDAATTLVSANLGDAKRGVVCVADVRWGDANLAVVDWMPIIPPAVVLGDERAAREWKAEPFTPREGAPSRAEVRAKRAEHAEDQARKKLDAFRAAVRANRQLATALRDQGMNEEADQFAYRALVMQRHVLRQQGRWLRWAGALFLDRIAGHGYRPSRSIITYVAVVLAFAVGFFLLGHGAPLRLTPQEALFTSIISFHGRGFFPTGFRLDNPITPLVAAEAICGLLIEITFIATFTQRFFGK
jgi:uncharacterized protein YjbI with pentapeptide repeats